MPSRRTSSASSIADDVLMSILPQSSNASVTAQIAGLVPSKFVHDDAMSDVSQFETSPDFESATAHEKHAYLHSHRGLDDDVF